MKQLTIAIALIGFTLMPTQSSFAGPACPKASYAMESCLKIIGEMKGATSDLSWCLDELKNELEGGTSCGAGVGQCFKTQKGVCKGHLQKVLGLIDRAYAPGADTSPQEAIEQAIDDIEKLEKADAAVAQ